MLVLPKQTESKIRWRRRDRDGRMAAQQLSHGRTSGRDFGGGPSQDRALYSCQCGYVFRALVSTSVGCPHCGCTQAW
jgi:hypothetical protein